MPRPPRLHVDGGFYHVILRGNHREAIFHRPSDRDRLAELVAEVIERFRMRVHAFCWMTNHVHLAMQVGDVPLGQVMMRIGSRFARHMQRQRPTTGHFFERRYRAILVDADSYLLELVRYIHLNHLIQRLSAMRNVSIESLGSSERSRATAKVRALIAHYAIELRIATLSAVARRFGRSASALSQSLEHYRRSEPALFGSELDASITS